MRLESSESWASFRLSNVLQTLENGSRPKGGIKEIDHGIPSIGGEHLDGNGGFRLEEVGLIPEKFFRNLTRGKIRKNDVLLVKDGATTGKVSLVRDDFPFENAAINEHIFLLRGNKEVIDQRFLFYHLQSDRGQRQIAASFHGAAIGGVNSQFTRYYSLLLPPIARQKEIADVLDRVQAARVLRVQADGLTSSFLESVFYKMFGDLHNNSNHFEVEKLDNLKKVGTLITYGIVQAGPHVEDGIPYIKTGDIQDGTIKEDGLSRTDRKLAEKFGRSEVHFGDLVFSIRATVGTVALLPKSLDGANLTQGTAKISPGPRVNKHYLLWYLRSHGCQTWIKSRVKGVTFLEITLGTLRGTPVLVPPLTLQQRFAKIAEELSDLKEYQAKTRRELDNLQGVIMQKAFRVVSKC